MSATGEEDTVRFHVSPRRAWVLAGLVAVTIGIGAASFHVLEVSQYVQQALSVFGASGAPSARFVHDEQVKMGEVRSDLAKTNTTVASLSDALSTVTNAELQARNALYDASSDFKASLEGFRGGLSAAERAAYKQSVQYGDLEQNHWLIKDHCDAAGASCDAAAYAAEEAQWGKVRDLQRAVTRAERTATATKTVLDSEVAKQAAARQAETGDATLADRGKLAVVEAWDEYSRPCPIPLPLCVSSNTAFQSLLVLLAIDMGAMGGLALSWLRLIGDARQTPAPELFLQPLAGGLAGLLGYFIIFCGATLFGAATTLQTGASVVVDPRIVVALSLLMGLGGVDTLNGLRALGANVLKRITGAAG